MKWKWREVDPESGSVTSGDVAKLFKNEAIKRPGALAINAASADATLLAREALQNSWDAGLALQKELGDQASDFEARFRFRSRTGAEKQSLIAALDLGGLAQRASENDRAELGLAEQDCLDSLDDPDTPLRTLELIEHGTTGMYGPWEFKKSRLFLAMLTVGMTRKDFGSGGSYGYGKGGLIRGSRIRSVVAHTCFLERPDDEGVTERLLGMTYWGEHANCTGFAHLDKDEGDGDRLRPFENGEAAAIAASLSLEPRFPDVPTQLGSTFLLVDPGLSASDLLVAVERNWWPALVDEQTRFDVVVEDENGVELRPAPREDAVLKPFIRGFELALSAQDAMPDNEFRRSLGDYQPQGYGERHPLGTVGLVADLEDWSYSRSEYHDGESIDHQSLVALVRGPRMVVEYYPAARQVPHVRGTVVASDEINDLLKQTEPKAHDAWEVRLEEEGIESAAPKFAKELLTRLRKSTRDFQDKLRPTNVDDQDVHLRLLDKLFRGLLQNEGGGNAPPPPPDPRLVSIGVSQAVEEGEGGLIRTRATLQLALTKRVESSSENCEVCVRLALDEDGELGAEWPVEFLSLPPGFSDEGHRKTKGMPTGFVARGPLTHEPVAIEVLSSDYDVDWSTQLVVSSDLEVEVTEQA